MPDEAKETPQATEPAAVPLPDKPFEPYRPTPGDPWDVRKAGHLLRRAGFGATPESLAMAVAGTPNAAVSGLVNFDPTDDPFNRLLDDAAGLVTVKDPDNAADWWVYRILHTPRPLQEKVALFWHNHFATAGSKGISGYDLQRQIEAHRRMGLGSFRDLLIEVGRQPAMLRWLDGDNNKKNAPNENYAREVMELFTLGVGNYTEADVKELARAFTGWRAEGEMNDRRPKFDAGQFDDGEKAVFDKKAKLNDEQAVDLLLGRPAASKWIARKLCREFLHPDPPQNVVDHYAGRLVEKKWELRPVLKEMLSSRIFFSEWAYRSRVKSPAELCVGAALAVGGQAMARHLRQRMSDMGQNLMFPPNVKGWDGHESWINANTVIVRFNFGGRLVAQQFGEFERRSPLERELADRGLTQPRPIVDFYTDLMLDGRLADDRRDQLVDYMMRDDKNEPRETFELNGDSARKKVRGMMHLLMATPAYQLA